MKIFCLELVLLLYMALAALVVGGVVYELILNALSWLR